MWTVFSKDLTYPCVLFPDVLVSYWHRAVHQEISDFFSILELVCLLFFRCFAKRRNGRASSLIILHFPFLQAVSPTLQVSG